MTLKLRVSRDGFQRAKEGAAVGVLLGFGLVHIGFMDIGTEWNAGGRDSVKLRRVQAEGWRKHD